MATFTTGVHAKELTDLLGIGVTLNPDGSILAITGPTIERVAALPTAVRNGGSLALRSNGTAYITGGGGVWFALGGATSGFHLPDDITGTWGTTAPGQVTSTFVSGSNRWDLLGDSINQATAASGSAIRISTGVNIITGAVVGNASAALEIYTGTTDTTNAGGTAGNTGPLTIGTGASTSSVGALSGSTGIFTLRTGDSADFNTGNLDIKTGDANSGSSGNVVISSGQAGATRGVLDINLATVDYSTQAINNLITDNSQTAYVISQGTESYLTISTQNGAEAISFGQAPSATAIQASVFFPSVGAITTNGIDFGSRFVLVEQFTKRPLLIGDVATTQANPDWEAIGTNATSALSTFAAGGGVLITSAAAAGDQQAIKPATTAGQTAWNSTLWSPSGQTRMKANIRLAPPNGTRTSGRFAVGLKLSIGAGAGMIQNVTDADQVFFGYSDDGEYTASAVNWVAVVRIGGNSANFDTGVVTADATNYRLVIDIDSGALARFYINGALVHTSAALTAGAVLLPFAAVQVLAATPAAKSMVVQRIACSRVLA